MAVRERFRAADGVVRGGITLTIRRVAMAGQMADTTGHTRRVFPGRQIEICTRGTGRKDPVAVTKLPEAAMPDHSESPTTVTGRQSAARSSMGVQAMGPVFMEGLRKVMAGGQALAMVVRRPPTALRAEVFDAAISVSNPRKTT